jgi:hypothetical protein
MIWDHAAIPRFLEALVASVGFLDGKPGNDKSATFEAQVKSLIGATETVRPWKTGVLRDGQWERDLDASFIFDGTLYVVECKAFSANHRIDRGDFAALKGRWELLDGYLTDVKKLAEHLEQNRLGGNYEIPGDVVRIEYCVSTPVAEYIPTDGPEYWFDPETPRICTPQELLEFATNTKAPLPS